MLNWWWWSPALGSSMHPGLLESHVRCSLCTPGGALACSPGWPGLASPGSPLDLDLDDGTLSREPGALIPNGPASQCAALCFPSGRPASPVRRHC